MMKIRVTPAALQDLKEIKEYISDTLCNPAAAVRIIKSIIQSYQKLLDSPSIGIPLSSKVNFNTSIRYIISHNYLIFYQASEKTVDIYRIIYARRDYIKILFHSEFNEIEDLSENAPD